MAAFFCVMGLGLSRHVLSREVQPADTLPSPTQTEEPSQSAPPAAQLLPCRFPDTQLIAQALVYYEGPYLEDGSDTEITTAALLLENGSDSMVEFVRITLQQGDFTRVFEITFLPPGGKVLAVDKNQHPYSAAPVESCTCSCVRTLPPPGIHRQVYVSGSGLCSMIATNLTAQPLPQVRIYYKQYLPQTDTYLGGITYCAVIDGLQPEETREIIPYHYLTQQGKILFVCTQE